MNSIGETLRRERLGRGLDLQQVSRDTRITIRFLESIEADRFDRLPGGVFTRSFVRQYARALGLDEEEIAAELQRVLGEREEALPAVPAPPEPEIHVPKVAQWGEGFSRRLRPTSSLPALAMVVVVMLVCSVIYTFWQQSAKVKPVVKATSQATAETKPARAQTPPTASEASRSAAAVPVSPAVGAGVAPAQPVSAAPAQPASAPPPTTAEPSTTPEPATTAEPQPPTTASLGDPAGPVHVSLKAAEPTWIAVTIDGKRVFSGTLQPNDTRTLNASGSVRVLVGNAGGLDVTYNGQPVGPLGSKGQVRILQVTPEAGAQVIAPAPSPVADDTL